MEYRERLFLSPLAYLLLLGGGDLDLDRDLALNGDRGAHFDVGGIRDGFENRCSSSCLSFIRFAPCFALKNSYSPSFSQPSLQTKLCVKMIQIIGKTNENIQFTVIWRWEKKIKSRK